MEDYYNIKQNKKSFKDKQHSYYTENQQNYEQSKVNSLFLYEQTNIIEIESESDDDKLKYKQNKHKQIQKADTHKSSSKHKQSWKYNQKHRGHETLSKSISDKNKPYSISHKNDKNNDHTKQYNIKDNLYKTQTGNFINRDFFKDRKYYQEDDHLLLTYQSNHDNNTANIFNDIMEKIIKENKNFSLENFIDKNQDVESNQIKKNKEEGYECMKKSEQNLNNQIMQNINSEQQQQNNYTQNQKEFSQKSQVQNTTKRFNTQNQFKNNDSEVTNKSSLNLKPHKHQEILNTEYNQDEQLNKIEQYQLKNQIQKNHQLYQQNNNLPQKQNQNEDKNSYQQIQKNIQNQNEQTFYAQMEDININQKINHQINQQNKIDVIQQDIQQSLYEQSTQIKQRDPLQLSKKESYYKYEQKVQNNNNYQDQWSLFDCENSEIDQQNNYGHQIQDGKQKNKNSLANKCNENLLQLPQKYNISYLEINGSQTNKLNSIESDEIKQSIQTSQINSPIKSQITFIQENIFISPQSIVKCEEQQQNQSINNKEDNQIQQFIPIPNQKSKQIVQIDIEESEEEIEAEIEYIADSDNDMNKKNSVQNNPQQLSHSKIPTPSKQKMSFLKQRQFQLKQLQQITMQSLQEQYEHFQTNLKTNNIDNYFKNKM